MRLHCLPGVQRDRYNTIDPINGGFESLDATLKRCLREQLADRLSDMVAVCLGPYSEHAYPVMVKDW